MTGKQRASDAVTVAITGGLGNQMFQYAAGRALAIRLGVPLKLDLAFYRKSRHRDFELDRMAIVATPDGGQRKKGLFGRLFGRRRRCSALRRDLSSRGHLRYA